MDDLSRFCCLNSDCPEHGKRGAGNLTVTSRYGPDKARRMLRCRTCKARFSERKGTPLFDSRLPPEKVESVLEHIAEGCGVRQTGRLCRVEPRHRRPLQPDGRRARPRPPRRAGRPFPPGPARSSSMRSGPSSPRRRRTATATDPADDRKGDYWDHVALDPEHRLVVSVVPGERTAENVEAVVEDFRRRTGGPADGPDHHRRLPGLRGRRSCDAYGETVTPPRTGKRGRPKAPYKVAAAGPDLCRGGEDAREGPGGGDRARGWSSGRWRRWSRRWGCRGSSRAINTSFVERQNGTDRHRNARKARKTYRFSKDWRYHEAVTYLTMYSYNFCWPVRTLRIKDERGRWQKRSPAMAAGLADHVWSMPEWLAFPSVRR